MKAKNRDCLLIGRFQPFHKGHLEVVRTIACDCDDIIIGNEHLDRLFGERGVDLFVAEPAEIGETLESGEIRRDPFIGEDTTTSQRALPESDPAASSVRAISEADRPIRPTQEGFEIRLLVEA